MRTFREEFKAVWNNRGNSYRNISAQLDGWVSNEVS